MSGNISAHQVYSLGWDQCGWTAKWEDNQASCAGKGPSSSEISVGWDPNAAVHALHLSPDSLLEKGPLDKGLCRVANANDIAKQAPIQHDPDHQVHKRPGYCWPKRACHISSMYPERFSPYWNSTWSWSWNNLEHSMPVHSLSKPVALSSFLLSKWIQMDPKYSKMMPKTCTRNKPMFPVPNLSLIEFDWLLFPAASYVFQYVACQVSACLDQVCQGACPLRHPSQKPGTCAIASIAQRNETGQRFTRPGLSDAWTRIMIVHKFLRFWHIWWHLASPQLSQLPSI